MPAVKQIKRVLKDHDVRDPRGALIAIEKLLAEHKARKADSLKADGVKCLNLQVFVTDNPSDPESLRFTVRVTHPSDPEKTLRAARAAGHALNGMAQKLANDAVSELLNEVANRG